ncbi:stalk domain-containing protein [Cellulosilyticum sp. ST5]|uniref:stalk domain-containing protein n=1 Tax=unclassified Cellulosilyticum TaxID=2643091 RepID=UPI000F8F57F7|nr:stalk domain-containing protein [Cellulosilyticum sp. WCF-2]QEH70636.1 hypothetical protein EKH84_20500 [Cellulosilyticum sp. WCF-2]
MKKHWGVFLLSVYCMGILVQAETYTYDDLNRLTKVTYESGVVIEYTYDQAGNIIGVTTTGGTKKEDSNSGNNGNQGNNNEGSGNSGNQGNNNGNNEGNGNQGNNNGGSGNSENQGNNNGNSGGSGNQGNNNGNSGGQSNGNGNNGGNGNQGNNNGNSGNSGNQNNNNENNGNGPKYTKLLFTLKNKVLEIDDQKIEMDASVFVSKNNRLMVPIRYITYVLNISPDQIIWDKNNKQAVIQGEKQIKIGINKDYMLVNGEQVKLSEKAQVIDGRTYLPIGDICRAFELKYSWDNTLKQLLIY